MSRMKTSTSLGATLAVAALAVTPGARAAEHQPNTGTRDYVSDTYCTDLVHVYQTFDQIVHTFSDANGDVTRLLLTGRQTITYTNVRTGESYSPSSTGVTIATVDGVAVYGGSGGLTDADGVLIAATGPVKFDAYGNIVSLPRHTVSICDAIGSTPL